MKVLIVEDEEIIRKGVTSIPKWDRMGVKEVRAAANAAEAFRITEDYRPDIILSDIKMPGMNGIDMCRKMKERFPEVMVIFLTGYDEKEYLKGAIEIGAIGYIEKPLSLLELEKVIEKAGNKTGKDLPPVQQSAADTQKAGSRSGFFLSEKVKQYVDTNYFDPTLSLKTIAEHLAVTPQHMGTVFRNCMGITVGDYMTECRLAQAKKLLLQYNYTVYEVCELVGYKDSNYFTRLFKNKVGCTPTEFREKPRGY